MTQPAPSYRLIVFDAIDDPDPVRELLCRVTGMHPTDANRWIAHMPGISARALNAEQVRALLDGLYELEIAAEARAPETIPSLNPVRTVRDVACLPTGFRVRGIRGEPTHWVPWDTIELIHAGHVEQPEITRDIVPPTWISAVQNAFNTLVGRPRLVLGRRPRAFRVPRLPVGEIVLVRREPLVAFRLAADDLNYSYLEDRLRPTATENFPLLLRDLCDHATTATLTSSTKMLLADKATEPNPGIASSSQQLVDQALLRLLYRWYRRDRDDDLRRRRGEQE